MDFYLILGTFFTFCGHNGLFLGSGIGSKTVLGSTHIVEQHLFSIIPLILTFDFDSILGSFSGCFLLLGGPNGLFLGLG